MTANSRPMGQPGQIAPGRPMCWHQEVHVDHHRLWPRRLGSREQLSEEGHAVVIIDKEPRPSGAWATLQGHTLSARASTATSSSRPGAERGRRARRGDERRQHQHPLRAHRPRELRHQRSSPASTTRAAPTSTCGSASPRWPRSPGPPSRSSAGWCPSDDSVEWTDASGTLHLVERPSPTAWAGRRWPSSRCQARSSVVGVNRAGTVRVDATEMVAQEDDQCSSSRPGGAEDLLAESWGR